jgi:hypothetical protein
LPARQKLSAGMYCARKLIKLFSPINGCEIFTIA